KRFGGEGTGAQCLFNYNWQTGETRRFYVATQVEGEKTAYSAYFYLDQSKSWKHLATFRTRTGGEKLKGLYSFIEDFRRNTLSAAEVRRATFLNGWIQAGGQWNPLLAARFTASNSAWEAKDSIDAGVADGGFYLQTGGDTKTTTPLNSKMDRPPKGAALPSVPSGS
ncbi:MAG TPA: DUF3472 domain-containing protein, partial [Bryobacteraceae bacterium]|nr:DUF3472 domain-containing protein [Bryobacteraceae bacterium]